MKSRCGAAFTVVVSVILLAVICAASGVARATEVPKTVAQRTVVVGDIHGDVQQFRRVLQLAALVDENMTWVAPSTTRLVQMGDLVDRGPDDKEVLDLAMRIRAQAPPGNAVFLLGNHEVMNLAGHLHYVHPNSVEAFGGKHQHKRLYGADGEYGKFVRSLPVVHFDGSTVFVHAGLQPSFAKAGIETINRLVSETISQGDWDSAVLTSPHGPLWTRKLITDAAAGRCDALIESLRLLAAERMVVGHTPQRDLHVNEYCEGRLIAVDVGISRWMYGGMAALEILEYTDPTAFPREINELTVETGGAAQPSTDDAAGKQEGGIDDVVKNDITALQEMMDLAREANTLTDEL